MICGGGAEVFGFHLFFGIFAPHMSRTSRTQKRMERSLNGGCSGNNVPDPRPANRLLASGGVSHHTV
jgi:hypothetical protein